MTPTQRFQLLLLALGVVVGLLGWGLRMLWRVAAEIQQTKDTTAANSKAIVTNTRSNDKLTEAVTQLSERVARLEGPRRR